MRGYLTRRGETKRFSGGVGVAGPMGYRASLHFRINLSVGIAFAWLVLLLILFSLGPPLPTGTLLAVLLVAGILAGVGIAFLWADWALHARRG